MTEHVTAAHATRARKQAQQPWVLDYTVHTRSCVRCNLTAADIASVVLVCELQMVLNAMWLACYGVQGVHTAITKTTSSSMDGRGAQAR
jgi:hypothetical protein